MHGSRQLGPALLLAALLGAAFVPHCFFFGDTDWEKVYIPAAERLRAGGPLFVEAFVYPPAAVLLPLPATFLPPAYWPLQFWLMNILGGVGLLLVGWRFTGGRFAWFPPWRECAIALLGLAAGFGYVFDVLVNRQIDLILAGGIVAGCWCSVNRRPYAGALLIGLVAAAKFTPLLFVPYLCWVRRWRAAAVVFTVALAANFIPDVLYPPDDGRPRLQLWVETIFAPKLARDQNPGVWYANIGFNHSLSGWTTRLGTAELYRRDGVWDVRPLAEPASPQVLKLVVAVAALGLLALAAWASRRNGGVTPLGVGLTLALMVLLSPMSSKPHFCVLVIPAWSLARAGFERSRKLLIVSGIVAVLGLLPNKDLLGGDAYDWILWHGAVPLEALALVGGCAWAARIRRGPSARQS